MHTICLHALSSCPVREETQTTRNEVTTDPTKGARVAYFVEKKTPRGRSLRRRRPRRDQSFRRCGMRHPVHRSVAYARVIIVVLRVLITVRAMSTPGRHRRDTSFRMPSSVSVARRRSLRRVIFSWLVHVRVSLGDGRSINDSRDRLGVPRGPVKTNVIHKRKNLRRMGAQPCDFHGRLDKNLRSGIKGRRRAILSLSFNVVRRIQSVDDVRFFALFPFRFVPRPSGPVSDVE